MPKYYVSADPNSEWINWVGEADNECHAIVRSMSIQTGVFSNSMKVYVDERGNRWGERSMFETRLGKVIKNGG